MVVGHGRSERHGLPQPVVCSVGNSVKQCPPLEASYQVWLLLQVSPCPLGQHAAWLRQWEQNEEEDWSNLEQFRPNDPA